MSTSFHIFKKDLRHTWLPLTVWLLLVLAQGALVGIGWDQSDHLMQIVYGILQLALPLLQWLMLLVIVPLVIHDEPLVGTTAFWFTRPIERATLLLAKSYYWAGLVVLPLAVELFTLAVNGATPRQLGLALPEIVLMQCNGILCIAVIAVFTRNFGYFALVGAIAVVGMMILSLGLNFYNLFVDPLKNLESNLNFSLLKSKMIVTNIIQFGVAGFVVCWMYLRRKLWPGVILAGVGLVVTASLQSFWTWDFMKSSAKPLAEQTIDPHSVGVRLTDVSSSDAISFRNLKSLPDRNVSGTFEYTGLSDAFLIDTQISHLKLKTSEGRMIPVVSENALNRFSSFMRADVKAIEAALPGSAVLNAPSYGRTGVPTQIFSISGDLYAQNMNAMLQLDARLSVGLSRYEVAARMALEKGAEAKAGGAQIQVTDVLRGNDRVTVMVMQKSIRLLFDPESAMVGAATMPMLEKNYQYVLYHPKKNQVYLPEDRPSMDFDSIFGAASRVARERVTLEFTSRDGEGGGLFRLDPAWMREAILVRLDRRLVERFEKDFHDDQFRFQKNEERATVPFNPDLLKSITLPTDPSGEQVRDYVQKILIASRSQNRARKADPQVEMLAAVGPEHLSLLIDAMGRGQGYDDFYLREAIQRLVRDEDKALVLANLNTKPTLSTVVLRKGWESDAREILLDGLAAPNRNLPNDWVEAIVALHDPETYPALMQYASQADGMYGYTLASLKKLPGFNLAEAVNVCWSRVKDRNDYRTLSVLPFALEFGHADALVVAESYLKGSSQYEKRVARDALKKYTPVEGDDEAMLKWLKANRGKLVYDQVTQKFILPDIGSEE